MNQHSHNARVGMSLVEVMCALSVITVALLAALGQMQVVNSTADNAADHARIQEIGHSLLDRIVGADPMKLATNELAWSLPRYEDVVVGNNPPLTQTTAIAQDNIITQQLSQQGVGLRNLAIYVEYYRGLEEPNGAGTVPGVMDGTYANSGDFTTQFRAATYRAARRLDPAQTVMTQVVAENPVVIRLIMTWDPGQRLELFAAKRRPTL